MAESQTCDSSLLHLLKASPSSNLDALSGYLTDEGPLHLPLEKLFGPELAGNFPP